MLFRSGALRRDEALKDDAELLGTFQFALTELLVVDAPSAGIGIDHVLKGFQIHAMEDVARVIVEGERALTVGVPAVANVPFFHLTDGCVDTEIILLGTDLGEEALDRRDRSLISPSNQ